MFATLSCFSVTLLASWTSPCWAYFATFNTLVIWVVVWSGGLGTYLPDLIAQLTGNNKRLIWMWSYHPDQSFSKKSDNKNLGMHMIHHPWGILNGQHFFAPQWQPRNPCTSHQSQKPALKTGWIVKRDLHLWSSHQLPVARHFWTKNPHLRFCRLHCARIYMWSCLAVLQPLTSISSSRFKAQASNNQADVSPADM